MKLILSKKASLIHVAGTNIVPGLNQISDEAWAAAKQQFLIKHLLTEGTLVDRSPAPLSPQEEAAQAGLAAQFANAQEAGRAPAPTARATELAALNVERATALIKETLDERLLLRWSKEDGRVGIQLAIKKQIEAIENETRPSSSTTQPVTPLDEEG